MANATHIRPLMSQDTQAYAAGDLSGRFVVGDGGTYIGAGIAAPRRDAFEVLENGATLSDIVFGGAHDHFELGTDGHIMCEVRIVIPDRANRSTYDDTPPAGSDADFLWSAAGADQFIFA